VIGSGTEVRAPTDIWVPNLGKLEDPLLCSINTVATSAFPSLPNLQLSRVADLEWRFDPDCLASTCSPSYIAHPSGSRDQLCVKKDPAGTCHLRSLYKHLYPCQMGPALPSHTLWKLNLSKKLELFCWHLLLNGLPTRARLSKWSTGINPTCPICRRSNETVDHIFTDCSFSKLVWDLLPNSYRKPPPSSSISYWFWNQPSESDCTVGTVNYWNLWKTRNNYIFEYIPVNPFSVIQKAAHFLLERLTV